MTSQGSTLLPKLKYTKTILFFTIMDIRNFFKPKSSDRESSNTEPPKKLIRTENESKSEESDQKPENCEKNDIGQYVGHSETLNDDLRKELLQNPYVPGDDYDFKGDASDVRRVFKKAWLTQYAPWMVYSALLKGVLCIFCVLFPQPIRRGFQGAFIARPLTKFKDLHEDAKIHFASEWHRGATTAATNFLHVLQNPTQEIVCQMDSAVRKLVEINRKKLNSILSCVIYCATHDLPLRGKTNESGNLYDLFKFRIESGDNLLKEHFETCAGNAKYTSVQTQNELLSLCQKTLQKSIIDDVNRAAGFSILADETADISGTEQLSIGVRFVDCSCKPYIREEFLGYTPIVDDFGAENIAKTILNKCRELGLNMNNLVGQGYDGCSAMAGKENGVQTRIRKEFKRAIFVHCASHRLNLVVNDLNAVAQIRNATGTVKSIISYIRDSPKRRNLFPNVPLLCETRWTSKYKSVRVFTENVEIIEEKLDEIAKTLAPKVRERAHELHSAIVATNFIVCLVIISEYSAKLEPVAQMLQAIETDVISVRKHITELIEIFTKTRENADSNFKILFQKAGKIADKFGVELSIPRRTKRMQHRANYDAKSPEDYYRAAIFIPYMDSLITALQSRFSENNDVITSLSYLLPHEAILAEKEDYMIHMKKIQEFYGLDNFCVQADTWFEVQRAKTEHEPIGAVELLDQTLCFPAVKQALLMYITLPATTCTVERSFSTLRRVKTWLRSTMTDNRLSALCMMSVHREKISKDKSQFIETVIDQFGNDRRRLQFLFSE